MKAIIRSTSPMDSGDVQVDVEYIPTLPAEGTHIYSHTFSFPVGTKMANAQALIIEVGQRYKEIAPFATQAAAYIGATINIP